MASKSNVDVNGFVPNHPGNEPRATSTDLKV